ncbi:unnamed protein product [Caenorhabditis nigoni]
MSFHQQSPGPSTSGTLSSGQPTPAPQQPSPSADVPQGNGTKVLTMLLERLTNIGKWKVESMRDTLIATIRNATRMEVENLWLATYFRKKGDPPSVDVGDRRPHSDRQPATPEEMASAQEFFEAVMSELNREMDRRGWFTLMSCTEAQAQAKARSTYRRMSTAEIIAMATHFAPDGYNEGFEFLKDPNSGDVAEAAAVEGQGSLPTSSNADLPGENSSSGSPPTPGIPSVDQHSEPDDHESDLETVLGDDETYNPGAAVSPRIDVDDERGGQLPEDSHLRNVAEAAEEVPQRGQKWWPDDHNSDRTTVLGDGLDDISDFDDEGEDDFFEDPDAGDAAEAVEDENEDEVDAPEQLPNDEEDAAEESFNFNDLQRSIDSEGMNEIPRGSGGLEDGLRPADTSRSYDLHQDHREDNLVDQADKEAEPISEANQLENEDEDEAPAEASNDVTSNAQGVEEASLEEGLEEPEVPTNSAVTPETSEEPDGGDHGSNDVVPAHHQYEVVEDAQEGSLDRAHEEENPEISDQMSEGPGNTDGVEESDGQEEDLPDQEMFAEENDLGDEEEVEIIPGNSEMSSEEAPEEVAKSPEASADPIDVDPPAENGGERAEDMDLEEEVMFGEASTSEPTSDDMESSAAARSNPPDNGQAEPSNVVSGEDVEATGTPEGPVEEEDQTMEQDDVEMLEENSGVSEDDGNQYEGVEEAPEEAFSLARTLDNSEATELSGNNDADQRTGGAPLDRGNVDENHPSGQPTAAPQQLTSSQQPVPDTPTEMIRALLEGINNVGRMNVEHMAETLLDDVSQADTKELQQLWSITDSRKQGNRAPINAGEYLKFPDHLPSTTEELERAEVFYEVVLSVVLEELNRRKSSEVQPVEDEAREVENHQQPIAEKGTEDLEQGIEEEDDVEPAEVSDVNQQFEDTDAAPEKSLNSTESPEEVPADAEKENPEEAPEQPVEEDTPEETDPEDLGQGVEEQGNNILPIRRYTNDPADLPMEAWRRMSDGSYANVRTQARFRTIPTVAEMEALRDDSDGFVYPPDSSEDDDDDEEIDSRSNHQEAQDSEQLERIGRIDEDDHEDPYDGLLVDSASSATSSPDHQGNQVDDMQDNVSFAYDEDECDSETGLREPSRQARPSQSYAPHQDHREDEDDHRQTRNPEEVRLIRMDGDQEMRVTYYDYDGNLVYGENGNEVREPGPSRRFRRLSEDRQEGDAQIWTLEEEQKVMRDIWELDEKERRGEDMSGNLPVEEIHENLEDDKVRNVENALRENREEEQEVALGEDRNQRSQTSSAVSFIRNGEDAPGENREEEQEAALEEERQEIDRRPRTPSADKTGLSRKVMDGEEGEGEKEDEEEPKPRRGRGRPPKKRKTEKSSNNDHQSGPSRKVREGEEGESLEDDPARNVEDAPGENGEKGQEITLEDDRNRQSRTPSPVIFMGNGEDSPGENREEEQETAPQEERQEKSEPSKRVREGEGEGEKEDEEEPKPKRGRIRPPKKRKAENLSNNDKEPLNKGVKDEEGDVEEVQEEPRRSSRRGKRAATDQPTSKRNPPKKRKTEDSSNKDKEPLKKGAEDEEGDVEEVQEEPRSSRRGRRSSTNQRKGRRNPPKERKIEKSSNDDHQSGPSRKVREGEEGESLEDNPARNVEDAPGENGEKEQEITLEDDRNRQSRTPSPVIFMGNGEDSPVENREEEQEAAPQEERQGSDRRSRTPLPEKSEPSKRVREGEGEGEKEDEEEPKPKRGRGRPPKKRKTENLSNNDKESARREAEADEEKEDVEEVQEEPRRSSRRGKRAATDQPKGTKNPPKKRKTEDSSNNDKDPIRREAEAGEEKEDVEEVQEEPQPSRRGRPKGRRNPPKTQTTENSSSNEKEPVQIEAEAEEEKEDVEEVQEEPRRSSRRGKRAATDQPTSKRNPPKKRKTEDSSNKDTGNTSELLPSSERLDELVDLPASSRRQWPEPKFPKE